MSKTFTAREQLERHAQAVAPEVAYLAHKCNNGHTANIDGHETCTREQGLEYYCKRLVSTHDIFRQRDF